MSELLTPDKIASLVEAAKHGELPEPSTGQRRTHRVRMVDFSRPTKFTTEQQRRITRAAETFCQTANTRLSAELRIAIEFELLNTVQLTWAAAQNQLPPGTLSALIDVAPIGTRMLFAAEQSFVLVCLEALLGGSPERPPRDRRLTEIDWSLTNRLFESVVHPLSLVWQELGGVSLTVGELDPPDAAQVASVSEPTLTILLEARIQQQSFSLALLVPWIAIEPVVGAISGREAARPDAGAPDLADAARDVRRSGDPARRGRERRPVGAGDPRVGTGQRGVAGRPRGGRRDAVRRERRACPGRSGRRRPAPRGPDPRTRGEPVVTADPTQRDALLRLAAATSESIARVLESLTPGAVERGGVSVFEEGAAPLAAMTRGSVAASVSYIDGVTAAGANIFLMTAAGARRLAGAMGAPSPEAGAGAPLSELELSALSEASNQMMATASAAIGVVLGQEIKISPPETRVIDDPGEAHEHYGSAPHATSTTFTIDGESCRLIQLVPSAFLVRMARALDGLGAEGLGAAEVDAEPGSATDVGLVDALGDIKLRVWAELGRAELPLGDALTLPLGAVVELDHGADSPVDLFVNGVRFARGHLIVTDDGEWAFALDEVAGPAGHAGVARAPHPPIAADPSLPSRTEEGAVT